MGKNNSVKKIDEEQILKRFEYTVQEYIRFYDFYKNQEVSEENSPYLDFTSNQCHNSPMIIKRLKSSVLNF